MDRQNSSDVLISGFTFYTLITTVLTIFGVALFKQYKYVQHCNTLPGPPMDIPYWGGGFKFITKPENFIPLFLYYWNDVDRKAHLFRIWIGAKPKFFANSPQAVEAILTDTKLLTKSYDYDFLHPWLRTGLLTSTGSKWQSRRKLLTPAFHFKILDSFVRVFNEQSLILLGKINKHITAGNDFDASPLISRCTLDVICESAMGRNLNAQNEIDSEYVQSVNKLAQVVIKRQAQFYLQPNFLFNLSPDSSVQKEALKILHGFTDKVIQERKTAFAEEKKRGLNKGESIDDGTFISKRRHLAFLDLLIEVSQDGDALSDADIREEVDTFMFEGYDTTSSAISFALFLVGHHPEIQEKIQEELGEIFGDSDRPATMADLQKMKYLECCIKESLRIYPSVPFIGRSVTEDTIINGFNAPAGSSVTICSLFIHKNPLYFPNPEVFDPERFLPENAQGRHPFAYVPFSAGMRNCIGQKFALLEEKTILSTIFRNFYVKSLDKREDIALVFELVLKSNDGIRLHFTPREKNA